MTLDTQAALRLSAGDALESFSDGAIGTVRDVHAQQYRLSRAYDVARRARYAYENGVSK